MAPNYWGAVALLVLIAAILGGYLIQRDPTSSTPAPHHRRPVRDPHDPIRRDDEPPPTSSGDIDAGGAELVWHTITRAADAGVSA